MKYAFITKQSKRNFSNYPKRLNLALKKYYKRQLKQSIKSNNNIGIEACIKDINTINQRLNNNL